MSILGYKVNLGQWDAKIEAANTLLEKGVDDVEVVGRTIMAWQMPENQPSLTVAKGFPEVSAG